MKIFKTILGVLAVLFVVSWVSNTYSTPTFPTEPSQTAINNTKRNSAKVSFVEGCTGEGGSTSDCGCYFDALDKHYGYPWYEDEQLVKRILSEGYTTEEIAAAQGMCSTNTTNVEAI